MAKKSIVFLSIFFVSAVLIAGGVLWYANEAKKEIMETSKEQMEIKIPQGNQDIDTSDWKTYRNEEYGFEINLPGDPNKVIIRKEVQKKENSIHESANEVTLYFGYLLDKPILRVENDPRSGYIQSMDFWYMDIVPVKDWKENACADGRPLCRQGKVLARNDMYVFESGFISVEGVTRLCIDDKGDQTNFCVMFNKFSDSVMSDEISFQLK